MRLSKEKQDKIFWYYFLRVVMIILAVAYIFLMPVAIYLTFKVVLEFDNNNSIALSVAIMALLLPMVINSYNDFEKWLKPKIFKPLKLRIIRVQESKFTQSLGNLEKDESKEIVDFTYIGKSEIAIKYYQH